MDDKETIILSKVGELGNGIVSFIAARIDNKPGQYAMLSSQGLQKIVLQVDKQNMLIFAREIIRKIESDGH